MADWRQIQARIRKARNSADPVTALTEIYQRTRDAMAAFELARAFEKAERPADAITWYTTSAERFRRAEWKKKAAEALERLGAPVPVEAPTDAPQVDPAEIFDEPVAAKSPEGVTAQDVVPESAGDAEAVAGDESTVAPGAPPKKRARRGRRGGRGRRRGKGGREAATAAPAASPSPAKPPQSRPRVEPRAEPATPRLAWTPSRPSREEPVRPEPVFESPTVGSAVAAMRGRSGDPGMASRVGHLESQLRRMLAATPHSLDEAESAPAGPGVFVVSESDQTTYYYIEACRTLRIALGQIARGRGTGGVRGQLAEHLGISESKVSKYLKDHCVVRWLQLDDDSSRLAHFAIAVLRPALNE